MLSQEVHKREEDNMKTTTIILIILLIAVIGGAIYYFATSEDKCSGINCASGQECNSINGKCELALTSMDRIEKAIDDKLKSDTSATTGMDKIENAINEKLNKN